MCLSIIALVISEANTLFSISETDCGASVLVVEGASESSLTLADFLSPTSARTFVYGDWDVTSQSWSSPQWVTSHPFVYADQIDVGPLVSSSIIWETDSLKRVMANGIYLHVSHSDPVISSDDAIDSPSVSQRWRLFSPNLLPRVTNCRWPSPPPPPEIPCGDSGIIDQGLCSLFQSIGMCYCDPAQVTASFASVNIQVFLNCKHSCGCCYNPPFAPSSPSPPPPLAPLTLDPCVLGNARPGSRCFVRIEIVACADRIGRSCLSIDRPFYAAFIKAECFRLSDVSTSISESCIDLATLGRENSRPTTGYGKFVHYYPSRNGFVLSAALRGSANYSTDHWPVAPPIYPYGDDAVIIRTDLRLSILPTAMETQVFENPMSIYTPNTAISPPHPPPPLQPPLSPPFGPPPPHFPPMLPPSSPPTPPFPPFFPPSPPPLCTFYDFTDRCAADVFFYDSPYPGYCYVSSNRDTTEMKLAGVGDTSLTQEAMDHGSIQTSSPFNQDGIPPYEGALSIRQDPVTNDFIPFPAGMPILLVEKINNCSYTKSILDCGLYESTGFSIPTPITQIVLVGNAFRMACYMIPHPPSLPPSPPLPGIPVELRRCKGFRIVISRTNLVTNYYRQWTFLEYMALGVLGQCDPLVIAESDPEFFGCYDMASPEVLGGDFVPEGEVDILDWNRNARFRNELNLGEAFYIDFRDFNKKTRFKTPADCATQSSPGTPIAGRRLSYEGTVFNDCSSSISPTQCLFHCNSDIKCNHTLELVPVSDIQPPLRASTISGAWYRFSLPSRWRTFNVGVRSSHTTLSECHRIFSINSGCIMVSTSSYCSTQPISMSATVLSISPIDHTGACDTDSVVFIFVASEHLVEIDFASRSSSGIYPLTRILTENGYLNLVPPPSGAPVPPPMLPNSPPLPCLPPRAPILSPPPPLSPYTRPDTSNCTVESTQSECFCNVRLTKETYSGIHFWTMAIDWRVWYINIQFKESGVSAWPHSPTHDDKEFSRSFDGSRMFMGRNIGDEAWMPNTPLISFTAPGWSTALDAEASIDTSASLNSGYALHSTFATDEGSNQCRMSLYQSPPPSMPPLPPKEPPATPPPSPKTPPVPSPPQNPSLPPPSHPPSPSDPDPPTHPPRPPPVIPPFTIPHPLPPFPRPPPRLPSPLPLNPPLHPPSPIPKIPPFSPPTIPPSPFPFPPPTTSCPWSQRVQSGPKP